MTTRASTPHVEASTYRPDIDGLRSIAVTAVVLFHAGLTALPGGYVGVDVFFVISGYLITRQVVSGVGRSSFSFSEFYLRRVRRLLPAALTTAAATVIVALVFLPPFRIAEIAQSAAAAAVSLSNVYFWRESGYWAEASASQPLLHTWSLSVEEQFYLVWPLLLVVLLRSTKRFTPIAIAILTALSVAITSYFSITSPDAAFYLTPFRTYEFAIGALCVWIERRSWPPSRRGSAAQSLTWLCGVALILFAVLTFDEQGTTFPGWIALVPTVGAALVIVARRPRGLDAALSNGVMRYIGLRSYSIYLVHWPVLVFAREFTGELTLLSASLCVVLTVALAELQYRTVERPLRVRGPHTQVVVPRRMAAARFTKRALPALGVALTLCVGSVGVAWAASRPEAYAADVRPVVELDRDAVNAFRRAETNALCASKTGVLCGTPSDEQPNVLVIGDSIGPEGFTFATTLAPNANYLTGERVGCPPLPDLGAIDGVDAGCASYNERRLSDIADLAPSVDLVVVSMRLTAERLNEITDLLEWLDTLGPKVAVLGQGAHYDQAAWQTIAAHGSVDGVEEALYAHLDVTAETNQRLADAVVSAGAHYIDRWPWMCDESSCRAYLGDDITDLVMVDTAHMTRNATAALAEALADDPAVQAAFADLK